MIRWKIKTTFKGCDLYLIIYVKLNIEQYATGSYQRSDKHNWKLSKWNSISYMTNIIWISKCVQIEMLLMYSSSHKNEKRQGIRNRGGMCCWVDGYDLRFVYSPATNIRNEVYKITSEQNWPWIIFEVEPKYRSIFRSFTETNVR